jgi:LacI family transcriptional regulator
MTQPRASANKISLRDVAAAAGVSRAAVSLVLNNGQIRISDDKRRLILETAKRLGYHPHTGARRLALRRMETLGLVFPYDPEALSQLYLFELTRQIAMTAKAHRYDILIDFFHSSHPDGLSIDPGRTDGTILVIDRTTPAEIFTRLEKVQHPHVVFGGGFMKRRPEAFVDTDVRGGTRTATRHLIDLGHRTIAFLAGIPSAEKYEGYAEALQSAGLRVERDLQVPCGLAEVGIDQALEKLMARRIRPTAIVATNDTLAIRIVKLLQRRNVQVPRDLSVMGFDDIETASLVLPSLSTVRIPLPQMADAAVHNLVERVEGRSREGVRDILPCELIVRDSTGPAPRS